jgi:hypothetical protein
MSDHRGRGEPVLEARGYLIELDRPHGRDHNPKTTRWVVASRGNRVVHARARKLARPTTVACIYSAIFAGLEPAAKDQPSRAR